MDQRARAPMHCVKYRQLYTVKQRAVLSFTVKQCAVLSFTVYCATANGPLHHQVTNRRARAHTLPYTENEDKSERNRTDRDEMRERKAAAPRGPQNPSNQIDLEEEWSSIKNKSIKQRLNLSRS